MVYDFTRHTQALCRSWTKLFDRLLWVPLRTLKRKPDKGYTLEGLFLRDFFTNAPNREKLAKELEKTLHDTKFGTTLFVLDGLDEISEGLVTDSEIYPFLEFLLKRPNVIITSRPSARFPDHLHVDLELETIGFYPAQVKDYIEKTFTDPKTTETDQEKVGQIQAFLRSHWLLQGLVRIPIQLDALCYVWEDFKGRNVRDTMTGIYKAIVEKLWKKDAERLEKQIAIYPGADCPAEIEQSVDNEITLLECLAFSGLCSDVVDFTSAHRNKAVKRFKLNLPLHETLGRLSFMRSSDPSPTAKDRNYHFIHLTFQEYFAARYFVRKWKDKDHCQLEYVFKGENTNCDLPIDPAKFFRQHKYSARYDVFWRFVAGLLDAGSDEAEEQQETLRFFRTVKEEPLDLLGPTHQRLVMHCLSEISSDLPIRENLEAKLSQWLLFEVELTGSSLLARESECPEGSILAVLKTHSGSGWKGVLAALQHRGTHLSDGAVAALTALLEDGDSGVRSSAVQALRSQSNLSDAAIAALTTLLEHKDSDVRYHAAEALVGQSDLSDAAIAALTALLEDEDSGVRFSAVQALGCQSNLSDAAIAALTALVEDEDSDIRYDAAQALGGQSNLSDVAIAALMALLEDKDSDVRSRAVQALGGQSNLSDVAIAALMALLENKDSDVRSRAVQALGGQSNLSDAAIAALMALLEDNDSDVRYHAAEALIGQSDLSDAAIAALTALLEDNESHVRFRASQALAGQSSLSDKTLEAMGLLMKCEPPAKSIGNTFHNPQFLAPLYGSLLCRSFKEQLSLYVDGDGCNRSCVVNQPSGLRGAPFGESIMDDLFRTALDEGRQLWNIRDYHLWDNLEGYEAGQ